MKILVAGIQLEMFVSQCKTIGQIRDRSRADRVTVYKRVAKDDRPEGALDMGAVDDVLRSYLVLEWFRRVKKKKPPRSSLFFFDQCVEDAKRRDMSRDPARGRSRITQIEYCRELFAAGVPDEEIIDSLHREFPGTTANPSRLATYRYRLRQAGKLPKFQARGQTK